MKLICTVHFHYLSVYLFEMCGEIYKYDLFKIIFEDLLD